MENDKYILGMIGLGTMGSNLVLNMADHGFAVAGYDKDPLKSVQLEKDGQGKKVKGFADLADFVGSLAIPRVIIMLVPAGKVVDIVIEELLSLVQPGDIIIDSGNSHFTDTAKRDLALQQKGLHFFGMGISGGETGARKGPSLMPGGDMAAYKYVQPVLEAIAAKVGDEPCVTYIGPGASGHYVKMVHNGIEYGVMQLIADTYEILRKGLKLSNEQIHEVFVQWNKGRLQSFLLEITCDIFLYKENGSEHLLLDSIKDQARSKGTGKWTSQEAMDVEVPLPGIDMAVAMRDLSKYKSLRITMSGIYNEPVNLDQSKEFINQLEQAFYFSMIMFYAQGMHLLSKASETYSYELNLEKINRIWRGGCIIRAALLEVICKAYNKNASLQHLLLDAEISSLVKEVIPAVRHVVASSVTAGVSIPAYAVSLSYFDAFRSENMPSNLIQAQRDYFGAHTFELIGKDGFFHNEWIVEAKP
ncbi:MAG: NADP-dependent phosphogluconate dehydrogenase [Chitinophagaceae bacterium]